MVVVLPGEVGSCMASQPGIGMGRVGSRACVRQHTLYVQQVVAVPLALIALASRRFIEVVVVQKFSSFFLDRLN